MDVPLARHHFLVIARLILKVFKGSMRTFAKVFNPFALTSDAQLTSRFAALAEDSFQTSSMACYLQTIVAHVAAK